MLLKYISVTTCIKIDTHFILWNVFYNIIKFKFHKNDIFIYINKIPSDLTIRMVSKNLNDYTFKLDV